MKYFFTILIFLSGLRVKGQNHSERVSYKTKKEKTDAMVVAKIRALPEVEHFFAIADKRELPMVMIDDTPDSTNNWRYRIKVGYSRYMFRSILIFDSDAKAVEIYYEDFMDESGLKEITLNQWRHWRNYPAFNKIHKFEGNKLVVIK